MREPRDAYDELYVYTMGRPSFILQHVVDAYTAQTASKDIKPMALIFALVGLYLRVEKQCSGEQVQRVHMLLARRKRQWPAIPLPLNRGTITVFDVLAEPAGPDRDSSIDAWCRCVWEAFRSSRESVIELLRTYSIT